MKTISNKLKFLMAFAVASNFASITSAGHGCLICPQCNSCCELKVEKEDVEKSCWETECKEICVPRIVFPWQKDCCNPGVNNGAWIKKVSVLKKKTYECPECKYTWEPKSKSGCADGCGCDGSCASATCDSKIASTAAVGNQASSINADEAIAASEDAQESIGGHIKSLLLAPIRVGKIPEQDSSTSVAPSGNASTEQVIESTYVPTFR